MQKETLPRWDLSPVYSGFDDPVLKKDSAFLTNGSEALRILLDDDSLRSQDAAAWLHQVLDAYQELLDCDETLSAYANACLTANTADARALACVNMIAEVQLDVKAVDVHLLEVFATNEKLIRSLLVSHEEFAPYSFILEEMFQEQAHMMSPAEEALAADLNRSGTDAWARLQESISSSVCSARLPAILTGPYVKKLGNWK